MVLLLPFRPEDFDQLIAWITDEKLLVTIAGSDFRFPVDKEQLGAYLQLKNSYAFRVVEAETCKSIGHAQLIALGEQKYKIDKLIIGDASTRGKGFGKAVVQALLSKAFDSLEAESVELLVFDWNESAIRTYRSCGMQIDAEYKKPFSIGDKCWTAVRMTINRAD
jgi:RimJ/RimL family protein N-acetyltransferase